MARRVSLFGLGLWLACTSLPASANDLVVNWSAWRDLPVQDGGRLKPFDSLARESLRTMVGRDGIVDPDTGQILEPVAAYLTMLLDWQGWDAPSGSRSGHAQRPARQYFGRHTGDRWDRLPLLTVDEAALRALLKLPRDARAIAAYDLSQAKIEVPESHDQRPFVTWAERLGQIDADARTPLERHALDLMQRYWAYQRQRMGDRLLVAPMPSGNATRWIALSDLATKAFDDTSDPTGRLRVAQQQFAALRQAHQTGAPAGFAAASESLARTLSDLSGQEVDSATMTALRWEVWSNHWRPFRWGWICLLLAATSFTCFFWTAFFWTARCGWDRCGWLFYLGGCLAVYVGVVIRIAVAGRWPGAEMYESVVRVGASVTLIGLLGVFLDRGRVGLGASALVGALLMGAADLCPRVLDASLPPVPRALQDTPWFVAHVLTTELSFAFLALACAFSNLQLGFVICDATTHPLVSRLTQWIDRTTRWGMLWLALGMILGGVWADLAWGRFWNWDPKEVWALVVLIGYLALHHARLAGWLRTVGTAAFNALCFQLVIVAWYVVNCVGRSGPHDDEFGSGPLWWVYVAVGVELLVVLVAGLRVARRAYTTREAQRLGLELPTSHP